MKKNWITWIVITVFAISFTTVTVMNLSQNTDIEADQAPTLSSDLPLDLISDEAAQKEINKEEFSKTDESFTAEGDTTVAGAASVASSTTFSGQASSAASSKPQSSSTVSSSSQISSSSKPQSSSTVSSSSQVSSSSKPQSSSSSKPQSSSTVSSSLPSSSSSKPQSSSSSVSSSSQPSSSAPASSAPPATDYSDFQAQVVKLVNQERAERGLSPLSSSAKLSQVATVKSQDMATNNYFSHTSPTYGSPFQMLGQFGVSYSYAGENIAMGQTTPQQVMQSWMNSEGHKANILSADFTTIGVGIAKNAKGQLIWTQLFTG